MSLIPELVPFAVFIPMWIEAARARRNELVQRARGGVEPPGDVYAAMQFAYPALFLAMVVEGLLGGQPSPVVATAGAVVFLAAKSLKWWAIQTLGPFWTFRVIVLPGWSLVSSGPYRFMRHPNYLAVVGEFVGVALMTGARVTGPIALLSFGYLLMKRIAVENRALGGDRRPRS